MASICLIIPPTPFLHSILTRSSKSRRRSHSLHPSWLDPVRPKPSRQRQEVNSQAFYTPGPVSHREPHHVQWCNQAPHMAPTVRYPKAPKTKPKVRPDPARTPIATSAGSQRPEGLAQSIAMAFKPWKAIQPRAARPRSSRHCGCDTGTTGNPERRSNQPYGVERNRLTQRRPASRTTRQRRSTRDQGTRPPQKRNHPVSTGFACHSAGGSLARRARKGNADAELNLETLVRFRQEGTHPPHRRVSDRQ